LFSPEEKQPLSQLAGTAQLKAGTDNLDGSEMLLQTAVVQGLGPPGWFDAATAAKFELSDNDVVSECHTCLI
jgi:hypothetical protein